MELCMEIKGGLGATPPTSWWRVLKARGASMRATRAVGTAKSLYNTYNIFEHLETGIRVVQSCTYWVLIGYLLCHLFYDLFDKEDKKESNKWNNELC
jgi:hypothetical protein